MIQDSEILKWFKEHKNSWLVILFTQPSLYLFTLLRKTFFMGIYLLIFCEFISWLDLKEQPIPSTMHSVLGVVISLLLVFRTNTAYDRWWEARKIFASLHASLIYFKVKARHAEKKEEIKETLSEINKNIFDYVSADSESHHVKSNFLKNYSKLTEQLYCENFDPPILASTEKKLAEVMDNFAVLERIKNTPIPISYSLHIKLSVFVYLLTLPLGLFFGMGLWVIPLIMSLFFIIAGIEIISNEIENPFKGDPNDLPIDDFKKETEIYIK